VHPITRGRKFLTSRLITIRPLRHSGSRCQLEGQATGLWRVAMTRSIPVRRVYDQVICDSGSRCHFEGHATETDSGRSPSVHQRTGDQIPTETASGSRCQLEGHATGTDRWSRYQFEGYSTGYQDTVGVDVSSKGMRLGLTAEVNTNSKGI